jgi:CRISPR-associated protein Cas5d
MKHYGVKLDVWGDWACFTRPEMKVERVSYDVITPSAARAIIEAIYWKPAIEWKIDKIHVLNEIKFTNVKRNEISSLASPNKTHINITHDRQQRFAMFLKDVHYILEAHFELTSKAESEDADKKHASIAQRRMRQGQAFYQPYLGCREFSANFKLLEEDETPPPSFYIGQKRDLGFMLYDIDFSRDNTASFFRAEMIDGIIDLTKCEVLQ